MRVTGVPIAFAAETDRVPANIDHFWITLGVGSGEPLRIALSTHSRQNAAAGFDPRVRVGVVISSGSNCLRRDLWPLAVWIITRSKRPNR